MRHIKLIGAVLVLILLCTSTVLAQNVQVLDSTMAKDVDVKLTKDPVARTNTFYSTDPTAYSWIELANVGAGTVTWYWYPPNSNTPFIGSFDIPAPENAVYYSTYKTWDFIDIAGSPNAPTGNWHVDIYFNGQPLRTEYFQIIQSPSLTQPSIPSSTAGGSQITRFDWIGKDADKVGSGSSSPDGNPDLDGHFILGLSLPTATEIKSIAIYSALSDGTKSGGQVWHSADSSYYILGVFNQGQTLDPQYVPSLGTFSGNVQFDLYASDPGYLKTAGNICLVEVTLGDGTILRKVTQVSTPVDGAPPI